ncbi:MAG: response regulator [Proteobacteria bacterium]|nr:MAG: response regulator [Pseudomonadota bacterium]
MDVQMPVMDGHEAVQKLRGLGWSKPIVALTAHAMREERVRAMDSGFSDYLSKPINIHELNRVLQTITKKD